MVGPYWGGDCEPRRPSLWRRLSALLDLPAVVDFRLIKIELNQEVHMATQEQVNAIATRIETATAGIRQDVADIKAAHPEVDLSALEARVGELEGLDAENPAPSPDPEPEQPAV